MFKLLDDQQQSAMRSFYGVKFPVSMNPQFSDIPSYTRGTLMKLHKTLKKRAKSYKDDQTRFHLEDLVWRIEKKLELED
jgi:hypothetical protein